MGPEPASYDPEKFVDGFQPWPRLLALKDGELLAKGEVFEHQTAARPKPAKHGSEPKPKQVKHGNKVIADPLAGCPTKLLISKPDRIVMRHNRRILGRNRKWRAYYAPKLKKRTALLAKLKEIFRQRVSHPVNGVIAQINPILRGWVNYFCHRRLESLLFVCSKLGRKEDSAASDACPGALGFRLATVE